jgi:hypothetical protein
MRAEALTILRPTDSVPIQESMAAEATTNGGKRAFRLALFLLALGSIGSVKIQAQASAAGVRAGDLQVGLGFSGGPHYGGSRYYGGSIYASFDFLQHWGVEADFHQVNTSANNKLYERTYEIGGRYVRHYKGFINPYGKVMIGRGVFNFANDSANLAYNMYSIGGGIDFNVTRRINARGDFEFQRWPSFPGNALTPKVATIGVAYHFR